MNLAERDKQVVWHPFTQQKDMPKPVAIAKAKGSLLFDEKGNSYIDAISSWWVNLHGHSHPYIAEKIYQQALELEHVIFAGFTHEPAVRLAERLLPLLPGNFSKIFYSDNGSTSTEVALKMAIQYWWNRDAGDGTRDAGYEIRDTGYGMRDAGLPAGRQDAGYVRKKILAFKNSYHGDTFGAMSVSDRSVFTLAFHELLFEVIFIDTPTAENIEESKAIIQQHKNEIAAFIYEPLLQGAGGMKMYDAILLNDLLRTVKSTGALCIADEVMTGFDRTGKFFASDHVTEKPDIICLSKGLTGGTMALGVTACTDKVYNEYVNDDKLKTFFHGHSFTANPIACSAALASLDLLEKQECHQQIKWISEQNKNFAGELGSFDHIKNIRCLGTILAFEIIGGKDEYLNNISVTITQKAMEKGVYIRPLGNTVYIMPPYCITAEELSKVYNVISEILRELMS